MSDLLAGPWEQDRDEVLDYQVPLSPWLASGEAAVTVNWDLPLEVTFGSEALANNVNTIWVSFSPEAAERDYFAEATITTNSSPIARVFRGHVIFRMRTGGR